MEGNTMSALLTTIGTIVTQLLAWIGDVATLMVTEELFVIPLAFFFIGGVCGLIGRILAKS